MNDDEKIHYFKNVKEEEGIFFFLSLKRYKAEESKRHIHKSKSAEHFLIFILLLAVINRARQILMNKLNCILDTLTHTLVCMLLRLEIISYKLFS